ncbi:MAG: 5-(carboxyamino)imidazole ribonucleotide synthase [Candidatus Nitrosopelagicus sp.]|jgi:5-(carboxyamino)imidazole ribonucleotide synthase|nr:5-(carboxyamino)imidazole ribonucleotide synthase [Candidatus Nitrosopelagicus sp.]MDP6897567.1 5-(carboxyamino)imidazole ribonucleotide synthase [Candidatus Nitrosopelagicus sp.]|tara:strand:+ start:403 stop:1548 length:1146 start_codon:yes stop_codon:yes gene_type:complete
MAKVLGIIGGGQLGMMITEAAQNLEEVSKIIVLDPTENCPAAKVGAEQIVADFKDEDAIKKLSELSDIITYEIESGNSDVLKKLETHTEINPSPDTLRIIQDKLLQKQFLKENDIAVAEFVKIENKNELIDVIDKMGLPVLLKTRRDAYDGRGNYKINSKSEIDDALDLFAGKTLMIEKFVKFEKEVSVIAARNTKGEIATYPVVENIHENNILRTTIAPGRVSEKVKKQAEKIAEKTMEVLHGAGVFGIEMFVTADDEILINEIAPRVHNSGHHTLQSCDTSQFEQHLRAILGMELGNSSIKSPTIMYNILGPKTFKGEYNVLFKKQDNVYLKMYGKLESKPQRKIGHINIVDIENRGMDELFNQLEELKSNLVIEPKQT